MFNRLGVAGAILQTVVYCSTVQCVSMWRTEVQYIVLQCGVLQYSVVYFSLVYRSAKQCVKVWCSVAQFCVKQCGLLQYRVVIFSVEFCSTIYCVSVWCTAEHCIVLRLCTEISQVFSFMQFFWCNRIYCKMLECGLLQNSVLGFRMV